MIRFRDRSNEKLHSQYFSLVNHLQSVAKSKVVPLLKPNPFGASSYQDLLANWLGRFPSPHTRRVYRADIRDFFGTMAEQEPTPSLFANFLGLKSTEAFEVVSRYQARLIERGLQPATINRKLAAIKSLVSYASATGKCHYTLTQIKVQQMKAYRDTSGIDSNAFKLMLATCDLSTLKGQRDLAILMLLWGNALRRSEVVSTNISDFDPVARTLQIIGKGRAGQSSTVALGTETVAALSNWLVSRGETEPTAPLFSSIHKGYWGHRLITHSIYKMVRSRAAAAGIAKVISPHRIRHSSITAALDATDGDVRRVQKLSRHSNLNTLLIYDDNRRNHQGEVTAILEGLI